MSKQILLYLSIKKVIHLNSFSGFAVESADSHPVVASIMQYLDKEHFIIDLEF